MSSQPKRSESEGQALDSVPLPLHFARDDSVSSLYMIAILKRASIISVNFTPGTPNVSLIPARYREFPSAHQFQPLSSAAIVRGKCV